MNRPKQTVPEPFELRTGQRGAQHIVKFQERAEQLKQREQTYCTFQPDLSKRPISPNREAEALPLDTEIGSSQFQGQVDFSNGMATSDMRENPYPLSNVDSQSHHLADPPMTTDLSPRGDDLGFLQHI